MANESAGLRDSAEFGALVPDRPPRAWITAWVGSLLFIVVLAFRRVASWDVWWHLAIGREALSSGTTVPVDTFSYSFAGQPYVHKDLIADILFYLAYDQTGFLGIALIKAFALLCAFVGFRLAVGKDGRPEVWLVLACVFCAAVQSRVIPRPLVFTIGFFPLMLGLLERARRRVTEAEWTPFFTALLPAIGLQWVWLNLHRGGVIGLVLMLGFALCLGLQWVLHHLGPLGRIAGPRPRLASVGVAFAAFAIAVAAGLVNAGGPALYRSALSVTHDPIHRSFITEWQPLTAELALTVHPVAVTLLAVAWVALLARLVVALVSGRSKASVDVWHAGVLLLFTYQGIASMRWLSYASAAAVVALALVLVDVFEAWESRRPIETRMLLMPLLALLGAIGLHANEPHSLGLGPEPGRYPERAFDAADAMELEANIHNAFVYGGYAIWRSDGRRQVLIDGRNDMVYPSEFFLRCSRAQHDIERFAALWAETGGDWVLADNTPGRENFTFLAGHPEWMAVYWSEEAVIYVLRSAYPQLEPLALRYVHPAAPVPSLGRALAEAGGNTATLDAIRAELLRLAEESPDGLRSNTLLALYFHHMGEPFRQHRDAVLDHLLALYPDHPAVVDLTHRLLGGP